MKSICESKQIIMLSFFGCSTINENDPINNSYRQLMRNFVINISEYAKVINPAFVVIPQNGFELVAIDEQRDLTASQAYLAAIDGAGQEDLFYGYENDNEPTDNTITENILQYLDLDENFSVEVLVTDYCETISFIDDSYQRNYEKGYISYAADHRELDNIAQYPQAPFNENSNDFIRSIFV